jgi:hypothetical protein
MRLISQQGDQSDFGYLLDAVPLQFNESDNLRLRRLKGSQQSLERPDDRNRVTVMVHRPSKASVGFAFMVLNASIHL